MAIMLGITGRAMEAGEQLKQIKLANQYATAARKWLVETTSPGREQVYRQIRIYALSKFLLPLNIEEDELLLLAGESVARLLHMPQSVLARADVPGGCTGSTAVSDKKALLLLNLSEFLKVPLTADQAVGLTTLHAVSDWFYDRKWGGAHMIAVERIREEFPILKQTVYGHPLIYLDNAATTQKSEKVIRTIKEQYETCNANVHRSPHYIGQKMTEQYEAARQSIGTFFGAGRQYDTVFTKGTTESINLVAYAYLLPKLKVGDEVVVTISEHHSNFVPFQQICQLCGAYLRVLPIGKDGKISSPELGKILTERTKLVAVAHVSNTFGVSQPIQEIIRASHKLAIPVLIDGAQAAAHQKINLQTLDCEFYCISGHKIYGPNGIGVLFGKKNLMSEMPPFQYGGEMIRDVTVEHTKFQDSPYRFEAGTPNYIGAIGLAAAADYLKSVGGMEEIANYEHILGLYLHRTLSGIPKLRFPLSECNPSTICSFCVEGMSPLDVAVLLDKMGVAVRAGNHCAQPLMESLGINGTVRVSAGFYNTTEEIDRLAEALNRIAGLI